MTKKTAFNVSLLLMSSLTFLGAQQDSFELYRAHLAAAEANLDLDQVAEAKEHLASAPARNRGWEWQYLNARADVSARTIQAHQRAIWSIATQSNGTLFATASADSTIRVWSFPDGRLVGTLKGHAGQVTALDFSPDGTLLASGSTDRTVRIWDLSTGLAVKLISDGLTQRVYSVRFAPHGTTIAVTSWEFNRQQRRVEGFVQIHSVQNASRLSRYVITDHPEASTDYLPNGRFFVTGGWGYTVRRYSVDSTTALWNYTIEDSEVYSAVQRVDVSPDGALVAVASKDDRIRVLDAETGRLIGASTPGLGHKDDVNDIKFSPDGKTMASASNDGLIILWSAETGRRLRTLRGHIAGLNGIAWSSDGRQLVSASLDGTVKIWNVDDELERTFDVCDVGPWSAPISSDGTLLVAACSDKGIGIWDIASGQRRALLPDHPANAAAISTDGRYVLTAGHDLMVRYWDVKAQSEIRAIAGHAGSIFGVDLHPKKPIGASASSDRTVRLWDLTSGKQIRLLDSASSGMYAVRFSPDGRLLATGSDEGDVKLWRWTDAQLLASWNAGNPVKLVTFSADGSMIAAAGDKGMVATWDVRTLKPARTFRGHSNLVYAVAFHPGKSRLVTASYDRSVRIWDVGSGQCVLTVRGGPAEYYTATFIKGGKELMLTMTNGVVKILKGSKE